MTGPKHDERRKFERVTMPKASPVKVRNEDGKDLGPVTMIGRGGIQVQEAKPPEIGSEVRLTLIDTTEGIQRSVDAVARNVIGGTFVGYEFQNLDADAAVEIGVIIGKYYSSAT